jgi:hypothetical protein
MSETKVCTSCGVEKSPSEFYIKKHPIRQICITCEKYLTNKKNLSRNNQDNKCARIFCRDLRKEKVIEFVCPVCNLKFGVLERTLKQRIPIYCSRKCSGISRSKAYREKSPYAKKIKRLLKQEGR